MLQINTESALKIILLFALMNSSIFLTYHPTGAGVGSRLIITALLNISAIFLIIVFFKLIKIKFDTGLYFKIVFILLILWSILTSLRGFSTSPKQLFTLFGHLEMGWAWITPFAVVFGFNIFNWISLYNFAAKTLLIASVLSIGAMTYSSSALFGLLELMTFLPIMALLFFQQTSNNKKIILISIAAYLFVSIQVSQRANIIYFLIILVFFVFETYRRATTKFNKVLISHTVLLGGIILAVQLSNVITSISNDKEASTDTRTFLFEELYADMSNLELITGRGSMGTYYSPYFAHLNELGLPGDSSTRSINEVGYLEIILKGGYTLLFLYILLLLPSAYLGVFHSNNIIARMSGYYIFSYLILWLVSYHPIYSAEYVLLWMAAGTTMSKSARQIRDIDLITIINNKNKILL